MPDAAAECLEGILLHVVAKCHLLAESLDEAVLAFLAGVIRGDHIDVPQANKDIHQMGQRKACRLEECFVDALGRRLRGRSPLLVAETLPHRAVDLCEGMEVK